MCKKAQRMHPTFFHSQTLLIHRCIWRKIPRAWTTLTWIQMKRTWTAQKLCVNTVSAHSQPYGCSFTWQRIGCKCCSDPPRLWTAQLASSICRHATIKYAARSTTDALSVALLRWWRHQTKTGGRGWAIDMILKWIYTCWILCVFAWKNTKNGVINTLRPKTR